ncbi:MAG: hypothetical protein CML55_10150 [Rhodobacteraceae bacterium]|nr:hypothetical protein [Paracoccaceae bacterium]MBO29432.1 hypothetical protein [Paracoccaceae bacterium]
MIRKSIAMLSLFALGACGESQLAARALNVFLDEPSTQASGPFPRFAPLLQMPQPYALQATLVRSSLKGGFLLESKQGSIESWLGSDGVALTFDRGLLHGTRGIGAGLLASDVSESVALVLSGRNGVADRIHTRLDGNDRAELQAYRCTIRSEGPATIQLDNGPAPTLKMVETCAGLDDSFQNTYWVDTRSDLIVRSRQWTGDELGELDVRVVYNFR